MESGVYAIYNKANGKKYVGSATDWKMRLRGHFCQLRKNKHMNRHLQAAFNLYGKEKFVGMLLELASVETMREREAWWIAELNTLLPANGYNTSPNTFNSWKGCHHTEETKAKLRAYRHTEETKQSMSKARMGHTYDDDTKLRISRTNVLTKGGHIYQGKTLLEWSIEVGLPKACIIQRVNQGWSYHDAIFTPKMH